MAGRELDPEDPGLARIRDAPGVWRVAALTEWSRLADDLRESDAPPTHAGHGDAAVAAERLRLARAALEPYPLRRAPRLFYTGARVEQAWTCLHKADRALLALVSEDKLRGRIPFVRAAVLEHLDRDDPQRQPFLADLDRIERSTTALGLAERERLRGMRALADERSDLFNREVRALRNVLLILCVSLALALAGAAVMHLFFHQFLTVCGGPPGPGDRCPGGGSKAGALDLVQIELAGGIGGLVSALPSLRTAKRMPGPYSLAMVQILFKFLSGAGVALLAILLLQAGALAGLPRQPGSQLVGYAGFFGLVQQALTTLADKRVSDLAASEVPKAKRAPV